MGEFCIMVILILLLVCASMGLKSTANDLEQLMKEAKDFDDYIDRCKSRK